MSAAFEPHCWNATSLAAPEYVMDFRSPNASCALATTVFASCAIAFPHRHARQIATTASFFTTATPPLRRAKQTRFRAVGKEPDHEHKIADALASPPDNKTLVLPR